MEILTILLVLQSDVLKGPLVVAHTRCTPAGDVVNTVSWDSMFAFRHNVQGKHRTLYEGTRA